MTHIVGGILLRHSLFSYRQRVSGLKQTVNNSVAASTAARAAQRAWQP